LRPISEVSSRHHHHSNERSGYVSYQYYWDLGFARAQRFGVPGRAGRTELYGFRYNPFTGDDHGWELRHLHHHSCIHCRIQCGRNFLLQQHYPRRHSRNFRTAHVLV
jgi:hypothetical protein